MSVWSICTSTATNRPPKPSSGSPSTRTTTDSSRKPGRTRARPTRNLKSGTPPSARTRKPSTSTRSPTTPLRPRRTSRTRCGNPAAPNHAATAETNLAYALWKSGRSEQALEHAERAVEIDPRFGEGWYNRGFFLLERGLADEAIDAFDNAVRLGFRNADVLEEKARALEEVGEFDRAEELAEEVDEMREEAEQQLLE